MALGTAWVLALSLMGGVPAVSATGNHPWEWAATFDLPAGHYTWSFTKKETGYADPTIQILVVKTDGTSSSSLEAVEGTASTAWAGPVRKSSYQELEVGTSYTLQLDEQTWTTHFILHVDVGGGHAIFLQHFPYEFENGFHFLQSEGGEDVEPVHEEDDHSGHNHGHGSHEEEPKATECPWSKDWEWAGIFAVSPGWYDWNAEKSAGGAYPDATMKIAVFTTSEASFSALQRQVQDSWEAASSNNELSAGGTIPLNRAITLKFNQETWASHFKIQVPANSGGHIAVFAQHLPIEFEKNYHYLKDASGADIEPEFEQSGVDCETEAPEATRSDRWGEVLGASFLTVLPTVLGLICVAAALAPAIAKMANDGGFWLAAVNTFASGVIFAAAVFLLLPEGLHLVAVGKTEGGGAGAWGTAVMCGWLGGVFCKYAGQLVAGSASAGGEAKETARAEAVECAANGAAKGIDWTVAVPILFGDMFHNLADGLAMGTAFKTCKASFAWKLTAVTVLHEAPQEIADFAVLVTRGRMHWGMAAAFNLLSGLATVLGAIITYSADVSYGVEGVIMAAGGGVYMYVAMTELGASVTELGKGEGYAGAFIRFLCFAVGATLIGLILLDHEHCGGEHLLSAGSAAGAAEGGAEEADGHGHGHR